MVDTTKTPYELLGGDQGIRLLADTFYETMNELAETQTIRDMHDKNLEEIKEKLYEYLSGWLGGPRLYQEKHNTVCLTSPHNKYSIGENERDQWLLCMEKSLEKCGVEEDLREMLKTPFFRIADAIRNQ